MKPRRVIDSDVTPSGEPIVLSFEAGYYTVRIAGESLMSSAMYGSEQAMADVAAAHLASKPRARVLVGGLGMGFTLRAVLDAFGPRAHVAVAELIPAVVRFNRGELGELAKRPLDDPRVVLITGDVKDAASRGRWDAILMDVDNGPEAFTVPSNAGLYTRRGVQKLMDALAPGGLLVVWSAFSSRSFERDVRRLGLRVEARMVRARASGKGPRHTLFLIQKSR